MARALRAQAVEVEVAEALAAQADLMTDDGYRRLVRHGHMPERTIQTGHRAGSRSSAGCAESRRCQW